MKRSISVSIQVRALLVFTLLLMVVTVVQSLHRHHHHSFNGKHIQTEHQSDTYSKEELYTTGGSSLPDCSHACGACYPCKRVMVSFKCFSTAEPCPIVYRCMCKGKYYHVPSN